MNTVLTPVYCKLVEPEEGRFDFPLVDGLVNNACTTSLKFVLSWFGTRKNSMGCFMLEWTKNPTRFARRRGHPGKKIKWRPGSPWQARQDNGRQRGIQKVSLYQSLAAIVR